MLCEGVGWPGTACGFRGVRPPKALDTVALRSACSCLAGYRIFDRVGRAVDILLRLALHLIQLALATHLLVAEELADLFLDLARRVLDFPVDFVSHNFPPLCTTPAIEQCPYRWEPRLTPSATSPVPLRSLRLRYARCLLKVSLLKKHTEGTWLRFGWNGSREPESGYGSCCSSSH